MRYLAMFLGTIVILSCGFAQGQQSADVAFRPEQSFDKSSGVLVDVPGETGRQAVGLRADMPQFGWCEMELGRTFEKGRYRISLTFCAVNEGAATVAVYVKSGDSHYQATQGLTCAAGTTQKLERYFFAPAPFSTLILKKMDTAATPSVALVEVVFTDMNQREYPRLTGYQALLKHPAPWGLRDKAIEDRLSGTDNFGEVEAWLDQRSRAAELLSRADYLLLAHRLLGCSASTSAIEQSYAAAKSLNPAQLDEFARTLEAFRSELEKSLGGTLDPATGTDIFTWIKSWNLQGHEEVTPMLASYNDGAVIHLMKLGDPIDFTSSWTTNTYTTPDMTVTYTILTPLSVIDLKSTTLTAEIEGLKAFREQPAEGWFVLASKDALYVFVTNRTIQKVDCSDSRLVVELNAPAAIGYLRLPMSAEQQLPAVASFYQGLLLHQPVECVQVQKGDHVEQVFDYVERACDRPVKPFSGAPVPHLVSLSVQPSSKLQVKFDLPVTQAPDGWAFVADTNRIAYELPERPRAHTCGINLSVEEATSSIYRELHEAGCQTLRLVLGGNSSWEKLSPEEREKLVSRNLAWIREVGGMKVGLDMHGGWTPSGFNDNKSFEDPALLQEFIERWKAILSWCEPYRDVIGWYDLMNEPQIFFERGPVMPYFDFMRTVVRALRPLDGETPFLIEVVNMANPGAVSFWEDVGDENVIVGYHDYWPHMFTHQRCVEPGDETMPAVYYPAFMPGISWTSPSWHDDGVWNYWDCWKCSATSLPVYQLLIAKGVRLDCGEYGVVGYAGQTSPISGTIWLRDAMERFKRLGINHDAWSVDGGFTWNIPMVKEELIKFWQENR